MEMKVKLPDELNKAIVELGFSGNSEFIEEAVRDKLLELKKKTFFEISDKISLGLKKNKVASQEILSNLR